MSSVTPTLRASTGRENNLPRLTCHCCQLIYLGNLHFSLATTSLNVAVGHSRLVRNIFSMYSTSVAYFTEIQGNLTILNRVYALVRIAQRSRYACKAAIGGYAVPSMTLVSTRRTQGCLSTSSQSKSCSREQSFDHPRAPQDYPCKCRWSRLKNPARLRESVYSCGVLARCI